MDQNETPKTQEQLTHDYNDLCARVGEKQFNMKVLEAEIQDLNRKIQAVKLEYAQQLKKLEDETKKKSSETVSSDSSTPVPTPSTTSNANPDANVDTNGPTATTPQA